jgi:hypothetical protein
MVKNNNASIAVIQTNILDIKEDVRDIKNKLEMDYVTKQEFDPVKKVVYGLVSLILVAVVGALITLLIK